MTKQTVALLGGSGFVGHHLTNELTNNNYRVVIITRNPARHREFAILPNVSFITCNDFSVQGLKNALVGCNAVVNLIGILNEKAHDGSGFNRIHVELNHHLVQACQALSIKRILYMSALGADENAPSFYLQSKGKGENLLHQAGNEGLYVTSFRPSIIFGLGDSFFNRFAKLLRLCPGVFPLPCHDSIYAPVYVGDVVNVMEQALNNPACYGKRYDLCGPKVYTLKDLVVLTAQIIHKRCWIVGLNNSLSALQARIMEYCPGKPFSLDNYRSAKVESVCSVPIPACFHRQAQCLEDIVPTYISPQAYQSPYSNYRQWAKRGRSQ